MPGLLYIVATPIGTLGDLSPRAQDVLKQVHFIACEDTRHTGKLAAHFGIATELVSMHAHNERSRSESLVQRICDGQDCALVTDAGTPAVSDPGAVFVDAAHAAGIKVMTVPGPSSLASGLAASGFLQPRVVFSGFLDRSDCLKEFGVWRSSAPCIAVFFESPKRILNTLVQLTDFFGIDVRVSLSREVSKQYEEHIRGAPAHVQSVLAERENVRGEMVICVELGADCAGENTWALSLTEICDLIKAKQFRSQQRMKDIVSEFAEKYSVSAKTLYQKILDDKNDPQ